MTSFLKVMLDGGRRNIADPKTGGAREIIHHARNSAGGGAPRPPEGKGFCMRRSSSPRAIANGAGNHEPARSLSSGGGGARLASVCRHGPRGVRRRAEPPRDPGHFGYPEERRAAGWF